MLVEEPVLVIGKLVVSDATLGSATVAVGVRMSAGIAVGVAVGTRAISGSGVGVIVGNMKATGVAVIAASAVSPDVSVINALSVTNAVSDRASVIVSGDVGALPSGPTRTTTEASGGGVSRKVGRSCPTIAQPASRSTSSTRSEIEAKRRECIDRV